MPQVRHSLFSLPVALGNANLQIQVALPADVLAALSLVRVASHWMFALFLSGACTCFVSVFLTPLSVYTRWGRWASFPVAILAFLSALTTTTASVIATIMFILFSKLVHSAKAEVNIVPEIGVKMFAFMWLASICAIVGWLVQLGLCCCCASSGREMREKAGWRGPFRQKE